MYNIYLFCGVLTLNVLGFFFTSIQQLSDEAKAQRKKKIFQELFQIISDYFLRHLSLSYSETVSISLRNEAFRDQWKRQTH